MSTATTATTPQNAVSTVPSILVHRLAEFKVKHMMISNVKGQFSGLSGTLGRHEGDVTKSKVEVTIDAASVNTRDAQRDAHLKGGDFFEVEKFPTLLFKSTRVIPKNQDEHTVEGELTIQISSTLCASPWKARHLLPKIPGAIPGLASRQRQRSTARTTA